MPDIVDITTERDEREAGARMAASRKAEGPVANGSCHYCGERLPEPMRFCDGACRSAYEDEKRLLALRGR